MDFNIKTLCLSSAVLIAGSLPLKLNAADIDANALLGEYSAIILNDASLTSEIEGPAYVGGNLNGGSVSINADALPDGSLDGALVVGGNLTSVNLLNGNALIGGDITGVLSNNNNNGLGGTTTIGAPVSGNINGGTTIIDPTTAGNIPVADVTTAFQNLSTSISSLTTGGNITVVNVDSSFFQTPNVTNTLASLFGPETTLFNVSGNTVNTNGFNFNGAFSDVIFNFFEATDIDITTAFGASILAPFADVSNTGGGINGTVVALNLNSTSEIRPPTFTGVVVPIPAPLVLLLSGLMSVFAFGRKTT